MPQKIAIALLKIKFPISNFQLNFNFPYLAFQLLQMNLDFASQNNLETYRKNILMLFAELSHSEVPLQWHDLLDARLVLEHCTKTFHFQLKNRHLQSPSKVLDEVWSMLSGRLNYLRFPVDQSSAYARQTVIDHKLMMVLQNLVFLSFFTEDFRKWRIVKGTQDNAIQISLMTLSKQDSSVKNEESIGSQVIQAVQEPQLTQTVKENNGVLVAKRSGVYPGRDDQQSEVRSKRTIEKCVVNEKSSKFFPTLCWLVSDFLIQALQMNSTFEPKYRLAQERLVNAERSLAEQVNLAQELESVVGKLLQDNERLEKELESWRRKDNEWQGQFRVLEEAKHDTVRMNYCLENQVNDAKERLESFVKKSEELGRELESLKRMEELRRDLELDMVDEKNRLRNELKITELKAERESRMIRIMDQFEKIASAKDFKVVKAARKALSDSLMIRQIGISNLHESFLIECLAKADSSAAKKANKDKENIKQKSTFEENVQSKIEKDNLQQSSRKSLLYQSKDILISALYEEIQELNRICLDMTSQGFGSKEAIRNNLILAKN